jgi:hypothetical protein
MVPRFHFSRNLSLFFSRNLSLFAVATAVLLLAMPAEAQWSAPGSTAIADESSEHVVVRNDTGSIALTSGFVGAAHLRWPLTHVPGLDDTRATSGPYHLCVWVRVRDTGSTDRVAIRVQELTDGDGTLRTLATWDSSTAVDFAGTPFELEGNSDYRTGVMCPLRRGSTELFGLDWRFRTYFIDASMSRTVSTGNPGIMVVKVYPVQ